MRTLDEFKLTKNPVFVGVGRAFKLLVDDPKPTWFNHVMLKFHLVLGVTSFYLFLAIVQHQPINMHYSLHKININRLSS